MSVHVEVELCCDGIGSYGCASSNPIFARTGRKARREARESGWLVNAPGGKDYCPTHRSAVSRQPIPSVLNKEN